MKATRGSGGTAPTVLNLGTAALYPRERTALPIEQEDGWAPTVGLDVVLAPPGFDPGSPSL